MAYDTEHFTSRGVVVSRGTMDDFPEGPIGAPPITSDPPFHHHARRVLLPPFSPKAIQRWEPEMRSLVRTFRRRHRRPGRRRGRRLAGVRPARALSTNVIARMLGLRSADDDLFRKFVHDALEKVNVPTDERTPTATSSMPTSTSASPSTRPRPPTT